MSPQKNPEYSGDDEIIERNMERSREVIEQRQNSEDQGKARKPTRNDPNTGDETALPGQWDLPAGGQSGPNARGGSSKRHKP